MMMMLMKTMITMMMICIFRSFREKDKWVTKWLAFGWVTSFHSNLRWYLGNYVTRKEFQFYKDSLIQNQKVLEKKLKTTLKNVSYKVSITGIMIMEMELWHGSTYLWLPTPPASSHNLFSRYIIRNRRQFSLS